MAADKGYRKKSVGVISDDDVRRISLTAYKNVVLDSSTTSSVSEEDRGKLRVRFASFPSISVSEMGTDTGYHRKYSVALKSLKPFRPSSKDGKLPINKVGFFSYVFASWLSGLVWKMYKHRDKPVSEEDVWEPSDEEGVKLNGARVTRLWNEEVETKGAKKASFFWVWWRFVRTRLLILLLIITTLALATFFSSAFLLQLLVAYLESTSSDLARGIGLVAGVAFCEFTRACAFSTLMTFASQTGTRFRSACMGIMYDKLLKLRMVKGKTNSEIINVFSVDSYRVYLMTQTFIFFLSVPVYLTIATVYCYTLIGPWCFVAMGTFVACYQLQAWLTKGLGTLRRRCSKYTDARVRRMGEVLNSMKFIKMYAWEHPFFDAIKRDRNHEQKYLLYSAVLNSITGSIIPITPTIATVLTIVAYTSVGNTLTASTSFAVVGTMNFLKIIVAFLPFALRTYQECRISFARIKRLLLMEEFHEPSSDTKDKNNAIEMNDATFMWDLGDNDKDQPENGKRRKSVVSEAPSTRSSRGSLSLFVLSDIQMNIPKGQLIGICGTVGCGKSSLMSAILGRMPMLTGHLAVNGTVAYVAQQAWIFNATLKDNILFGRDYNMRRYMDTIKACALETDLELLADGDDTEIGERGANLSGGQKQRVNLARAVYSDSDIYILDDPLSAVDVRVGKLLFHDCIKRTLAGKTVILVTHQLQYLKHCDEVVVMEEGAITEKGNHLELLAQNGTYTKMFRVFDLTTMKTTNNNGEKKKGDADQGDNSVPPKEATLAVPPTSYGTMTNGARKKTKKKKRGRLVLQEETGTGTVSFDTYKTYIMSAGGVCVAVAVIALYVLAAASVVFSDWWLSQWITSMNEVPPGSLYDAAPFTTGDNSSELSTIYPRLGNISTLLPNISNYSLPTPETSTTGTIYGDDSYTSPIDLSLTHLSYNTFLYVYIGALVGMILLQIVKGFGGGKAFIMASNGIHKKSLGKVLKAKMSFFDATPAGRILNRFSKDLDEGDVFIPQMTNALLQIMCQTCLSILLTALVTPWILIAVVPVVLIYGIMKTMATVSVRQLKRLENVVRSPLLSHVNVTSSGLPTIVAYGQQGRFSETCQTLGGVASTALLLFDVSMRWVGLRLDLTSCTITIGTALILVLTKGSVSPADAGLILSLCGKTVGVMPFLVRVMNETEARFTSMERLNDYAKNLPTEPQHAAKMADSDWPAKGKLEFCEVVMKYRPDMALVLKNVSFTIEARQKIGVVGRTGAGKSSLAACLFRLVELTSGSIKIDDIDISQIHLRAIRSRISTIPQDPVLFAGTIRYNIDPFSNYTEDAIWDALEKVNMKDKLDEVEEGLSLEVEENGENFSVGERQLLCLARAVLRNSKILLLDEATANIDTSTDAMIQDTIRNCFKDCTVITIAHRLNTVLHSDKIIVMDAGQVVECETPQDLLSNPYSFLNRMIAAQSVKTPSP